jgi:6-phosphogluconolactonase
MTDSTVNYRNMGPEESKIFTFPTTELLAQMLAEKVLNMVRQSIISGRNFNIALSGGSTPRVLFEHIARDYRDPGIWDNSRFYWVDERCVPPDHPESNYRMAREALLRYLSHSYDNVFRIMGEEDPHREAERYGRLLMDQIPLTEGVPAFDLILLGIGRDGHTASIFPDQMELLWTDSPCAVAIHPDSGQRRITLSGRVINNADLVFFLVTGEEKADVVARIICKTGGFEEYPAAHIRPLYGILSWFLDDGAARLVNTMQIPGGSRG